LTDQRRAFCDEYLKCYNGTKAAIASGYSETSAASQASQILDDKEVKKYIESRLEKASNIALVDLAWIQQRAKDISDRCMQAEPVLIRDGHGGWIESGEYTFDSSGANKATEMLGKMIGAFEKDNQQSKPESTTIVNLGTGLNPDEAIT
jgi:phage terminase small subunit